MEEVPIMEIWISGTIAQVRAAAASGLAAAVAGLFNSHGSATRIVTASVRSPQQAEAALLAGAHAVVVFDDVFKQMFASALTQASIDGFERDWEQIALHAQSAQQPTF